MLPLNKLALQLGLIDEYNEWQTEDGATQDYVIVTTPVLRVQVVRDTDNRYDVALSPNGPFERFWERPKKSKVLIKIQARTLVALSDAILKRLVEPHKEALVKAYTTYQQGELDAAVANDALKVFTLRYKVKEEDILWAGIGNRVAGYFLDDPDVAVHVSNLGDDGISGSIKVKGLTMTELDELIRAVNVVRTKRWMRGIQEMNTQTEGQVAIVTPSITSDPEESLTVDIVSVETILEPMDSSSDSD